MNAPTQAPQREPQRQKADLFKIGTEIGFKDKDEIIDILRRNGVNGSFDPKEWDTYLAVLRREKANRMELEQLEKSKEEKRAALRAKARDHELPPCPVCGSPTIRDYKWDRTFRNVIGWRCTGQGGENHYVAAAWSRVKYLFVHGNQGGEPDLSPERAEFGQAYREQEQEKEIT
jgi:hypothetical protein